MNPTKFFAHRFTLLRRSVVAVLLSALFALSAQGTAQTFDRKVMLENIALNVILPCHEHFAEQATLLDDAAQALTSNLNLDNLAEAKATWNDAAFAWAQCEPYAFGGLGAMILYNQIYKTPINPLQIEKILDDAETPDAVFTDKVGSSARGLGTLAYFLFSQDEQAVLETLQDGKRAAYLTALTANVQAKAEALVTFWSPTGENYAATFAAADQEGGSVKGSLNMLVNELIAALEKAERGSRALSAGELEPGSLERVQGNLLGAQRLFMGADGLGVDDYLSFLGAGDLADEIAAQFDEAAQSLDTGSDTLSPEQVSQVYDHIERLSVLIGVDTANQLGITVTFNDSDGD